MFPFPSLCTKSTVFTTQTNLVLLSSYSLVHYQDRNLPDYLIHLYLSGLLLYWRMQDGPWRIVIAAAAAVAEV
jgi:hypothetical protein